METERETGRDTDKNRDTERQIQRLRETQTDMCVCVLTLRHKALVSTM